jgi:hypothetical protein
VSLPLDHDGGPLGVIRSRVSLSCPVSPLDLSLCLPITSACSSPRGRGSGEEGWGGGGEELPSGERR